MGWWHGHWPGRNTPNTIRIRHRPDNDVRGYTVRIRELRELKQQSPEDSGLCCFQAFDQRGSHRKPKFSDLPIRKSCRKPPSVARELAPAGRRSRPKPCRSVKQHPTPVAAGEACVRLRSGRKPVTQGPPDTKQPPIPDCFSAEYRLHHQPQNPNLRPTHPFAATKIDASLTAVSDWVSQPYRIESAGTVIRHPGELRLRRSLWRLCVGDFRVCRV